MANSRNCQIMAWKETRMVYDLRKVLGGDCCCGECDIFEPQNDSQRCIMFQDSQYFDHLHERHLIARSEECSCQVPARRQTEMGYDLRGVLRGECCCGECDFFERQKDSQRCGYCDCVPVRHQKLKTEMSTGECFPSGLEISINKKICYMFRKEER